MCGAEADAQGFVMPGKHPTKLHLQLPQPLGVFKSVACDDANVLYTINPVHSKLFLTQHGLPARYHSLLVTNINV